MFMLASLLLIDTPLYVDAFVIQPRIIDFSTIIDHKRDEHGLQGSENEKTTGRYAITTRRQKLSMLGDSYPRLDAFNLYLYKTGYGYDRSRPSRDPRDCRRTLATSRLTSGHFSNIAEPCFEDNDLMTSFNAQPLPNPGHSLFIPVVHPSELRSKEIRRYQELVYQRLLTLLNNFRMNRRTKNWYAQQNARTEGSIGDWYNDIVGTEVPDSMK